MSLAMRAPRLTTLLSVAPLMSVARDARAAEPTKQECIEANERSGPLRQSGKLREARASLLRCSAPGCPGAVRDDCVAGATRLEQAIPTVVFVAQDVAGNELVAVTVAMDGQPLAGKLGGAALEVDPGEHTFVLTARGLPPVERRLVLHEGEKNRRERVQLGAASAATAPRETGEPAPVASEDASGAPSTWTGQRKAALVVAGVGVAGIGVGSVFGLLAGSGWSQARSDCGASCSTTSTAQSEADSAHTKATVANVLFGVGAAAVVTGAVLWFLPPSASAGATARVTPLLGPSVAGLAVTGRLP